MSYSDELWPGHVTPARLEAARGVLTQVCETDTLSIQDNIGLATALQGVARAISDIVIARGTVERINLPDVPPEALREDAFSTVLRRYILATPQGTRMFTATTGGALGVQDTAGLAMDRLTLERQSTLWDVTVPSDRYIDQLLLQEPSTWNDSTIRARNLQRKPPVIAYPFDSMSAPDTRLDTQFYFNTLRTLSAELLARA